MFTLSSKAVSILPPKWGSLQNHLLMYSWKAPHKNVFIHSTQEQWYWELETGSHIPVAQYETGAKTVCQVKRLVSNSAHLAKLLDLGFLCSQRKEKSSWYQSQACGKVSPACLMHCGSCSLEVWITLCILTQDATVVRVFYIRLFQWAAWMWWHWKWWSVKAFLLF